MSTYDTEQLERLEPTYLANYGLSQAPFSNQHNDRFLYLDAERAQRLNLLQHMTQYSNLLLIVQGEKGVGKTSLLTRFVNTKADNWHICQVTANTFMDAGQLLFLVAQGFGVEQMPHDSGELQEMLYARIATYHHNDQTPILLIDDAHELPKDALLAIFHLADTQVDNANLLRIILFAEPQIERILNARDVRSLRERITHTMVIPPLDEDTTAEYLKHRMAAAGFSGGSPFTPKMVKRIYKVSGGIPARINQLAHETLDKGDFEREDVEDIVKPAQPRRQYKTGTLIAIGVALLALILVFQNRINRLFQDKSSQTTTVSLPLADKTPEVHPQTATSKPPPATTPPPPAVSPPAPTESPAKKPQLQEKIIPLHPPAAQPVQSTPTSSPAPSTDTARATVSANKSVQKTPVLPQVAPPSKPAPAPKPVAAVPQIHVDAVAPNPVPASDQAQTITVQGEGFTADSRVYVRWTNKDHEIPPARVKMLSDKQLQVRLTVGTRHDKWQLHVTDPKRGDSNVLKFNVATANLNTDKSRDWILAQKPGMYTLQLFGSHEMKNAEAFIRQHRLGQQAHYFASIHKGRRLYSVVYGAYPNETAAHAAVKTLPASLRKVRPWVRRFGDIQASIHTPRQQTQPLATKSSRPLTALPASSVFTTALPKHANIEQYASWLWSQDPRYFTLQLLGARELASVKKFLKRYPELAGATVYFRTRHQGRDWYAVVYGVYPDRQKAREAIKRLPRRVQKASPWIRSFASIQADLSRTQ